MKAWAFGCAGLSAIACMPPAEPAEPVQTPEPVQQDGAIPWADGQAPDNTTRDVGEQPRSMDDAMGEDTQKNEPSDGVGQAGASAQCTGRAPVPLRAESQARASSLQSCAEEAPEGAQGKGTIKYSVRIATTGKVERIYQLEDTLHVAQVTACVEKKLAEDFEERPVGGCVQFLLPVEFDLDAAAVQSPSEEQNFDPADAED